MDEAFRKELLDAAEKAFRESIMVKEALLQRGFGLLMEMAEMLSAALG